MSDWPQAMSRVYASATYYNPFTNYLGLHEIVRNGFKEKPALHEQLCNVDSELSSSNSTDFAYDGLKTNPLPPSPPLQRDLNTKLSSQQAKKKTPVCVFCRNNGESVGLYTSHYLKDADGKVTCPVLRAYTCPLCGANGDTAHTIKYCKLYCRKWKVIYCVCSTLQFGRLMIILPSIYDYTDIMIVTYLYILSKHWFTDPTSIFICDSTC